MTKIELELITDFDMFIFFEKGTRGEIYYIVIDSANAYLKSFDPKQESNHVI